MYDDEACGQEGSTTAECATWGPDGKMIQYGDWSDTVSNRSTPADVLALLNWAASQTATPSGETREGTDGEAQ